MIRLVVGLALVLVLALVLLRRSQAPVATVPTGTPGEAKTVPLMEAPQHVKDTVQKIEAQNRAAIEKTLRESEAR